MSKKSIKDMNNIEKLRNSLSAKTVRSTVKSCIVFGVVCQIVALTLFTVSLTKQYLNVATVAANQAKMAAIHETNAVVFSKSIMDVYNSLGEDERQKMGTEEYRSYFSEADIHSDGNYDDLFTILNKIKNYKNTLETATEDDAQSKETWDELEKSIVANIASDVIVGVKKDSVDLTIVYK